MYRLFASLILFSLCCSCSSSDGDAQHSKQWRPLQDSIRIPDPLNEQYFKVRIDSTKRKGAFQVTAAYGYNEGNTLMVLPRGAENYYPVLRRADSYMTFIIGFRAPSDDSAVFYDYYQVRALQKTVEMNYIKAYSFQ